MVQRRVQRGRLAAAGRSSHQHDAVGLIQLRLVGLQLRLGHAQLVQPDQRRGPVENTQHHTFTVDRGHRGHPQVHRPLGRLKPDVPVLGHKTLRDVHAAHDFQTRHDRRLQVLGRRALVVQHAVDPKLDLQVFLERLYVDVARPGRHRLVDDQVHQVHHRRFARQGLQVLGQVHGCGIASLDKLVAFALHRTDQPRHVRPVGPADRLGHRLGRVDLRRGGQPRLHHAALARHQHPHHRQGSAVKRVGQGHHQRVGSVGAGLPRQRKQAVARRNLHRHPAQGLGVRGRLS